MVWILLLSWVWRWEELFGVGMKDEGLLDC